MLRDFEDKTCRQKFAVLDAMFSIKYKLRKVYFSELNKKVNGLTVIVYQNKGFISHLQSRPGFLVKTNGNQV